MIINYKPSLKSKRINTLFKNKFYIFDSEYKNSEVRPEIKKLFN